MSFTEFQKRLISAIAAGEITDAVSFMEKFCDFDRKESSAVLMKDVYIFYVSQNLDKNYQSCRAFVTLVEILRDKDLIRLSFEKSAELFQILKWEDGPMPAHKDTRLIDILNDHVGKQGDGLVSAIHIVPLPELNDLIDRGYETSELTGVKLIDDVIRLSKHIRKRPLFLPGIIALVVVVLGMNEFFRGCLGEKGKQAARINAAGRAHLAAVRPSVSLKMSDDVFNLSTNFSFENAGNSGTTERRGFAKLVLSDQSFNPTAQSQVHVLDSVGITQTGSVRLRNNEAPFSRQSWAVEHDSLYIYLFGRIDYRDVFNKWHWTEFAFKYDYRRRQFEKCCDYNDGN
jgi:hypothetical protein